MNIINKYMSQTLNQYDLARMLGPLKDRVKIMKYDDLEHVTLENLFNEKTIAVIVFLQIHGKDNKVERIGHWIVLLHADDHYEHFDSYGISVEAEVATTHVKKDLIKKLFSSAKKSFVESKKRLQSHRHDMDTCGRWCVARIRLYEHTLPEFYNLIETINHVPDVAVTSLTMFL